jgi:peptidoglycan-N-acetylglucosamine deacetylase
VTIVSARSDLTARLLCLTFDDGPGPHTGAVLDVLGAHQARGTFFVLGSSIEGYEDVLARTIAEEHEVANHTFSHPHALQFEDAELAHDIARCQRVLGGRPQIFRPPYGEDPLRCARLAAERGLPTTALWSIDPRDFLETDPKAIARVIVNEAAPGAIVDLHDHWPPATSTVRDRRATAEALAVALPQLVSMGYRCVTVSEMLAA